MKTKKVLGLVIILLFLIYVFLTIQFSKGLILNLQLYSNYNLIPFVFWTFTILLSVFLTLTDIGFLKIGAIMGIMAGVLIITLQMVNTTSEFDLIESNDYKLIVERIGSPDPGKITVYKRVNPFFSEYVDSIQVASNYDLTFEIIGDTLIMSRCTTIACVPIEIELE